MTAGDIKLGPQWNTQLERIAAARLLLPDPSSTGFRVGAAIHAWIRDGGRTPENLYLGTAEYRSLRELVEQAAMRCAVSDTKAEGEYFMGLRVYRVLDSEHLRVC